MSLRFSILALVTLSFAIGVASHCLGQDPDEAVEVAPDPKVVLLNELAKEGDETQLASTIQQLIRMGAWPDAQRWLESVASIDDNVVLGNIAERIEPSTLLKALNHAGLSDVARAGIAKIIRATAPDPLIVQLNERAARNNEQLAESIGALARLGQWVDVQRWLERVTPINDTATLADMASRIGPPILVRIANNSDLSKAASAAALKLAKAGREYLESKDRLVAAVGQLGGTVDQRLGAMRVLVSGGDNTVLALVEATVAADQPTAKDDMLRIMKALGRGGEHALSQLALYGEPQIRRRALIAVTRLNPKQSVPTLLTALHAGDSTQEESGFARASLQRISGTVPGRSETLALLLRDLRNKRNIANRAANNSGSITLWSVNQAGNGVSHQRTRTVLAAYRNAADASARLRRVGGFPQSALDDALAADLGYRVMTDPDWGDQAQIDELRGAYGEALSDSNLSNAIDRAIATEDLPAAIGLMRLITAGASVVEMNVMLSSQSPRITPLVAATLHSIPRVRYEAASAIARMAPTGSYPGRSHVKRCFSEMKQLGNRPLAVLVETRSEVVLRQETILSELGYKVDVVQTVAEVERWVSKGGELGLIVSKTQLADMPPVELIDRVRRLPKGNSVPIVFYGQPAAGIVSERWDGLARLINLPRTPAAYSDILLDLESAQRLPPMTALDRQFYQRTATERLDALLAG